MRSRADGYTILWANNMMYMSNIAGFSTYNWDDFTPLFVVFSSPWALTVRKDIPVNSAQELFDFASNKPGALTMSYMPTGNVRPMLMDTVAAFGAKLEDFRNIANIAGDANRMMAMLQGNLDVSLSTVSSVLPYVESGDLKLLGLTGTKGMPNVKAPLFYDQGFKTTLGQSTYVAFGPKGIPQDVVDYLAETAKKTLEQPGLKEEGEKFGIVEDYYAGEELRKRISSEYNRMKDLATQAGIAKK